MTTPNGNRTTPSIGVAHIRHHPRIYASQEGGPATVPASGRPLRQAERHQRQRIAVPVSRRPPRPLARRLDARGSRRDYVSGSETPLHKTPARRSPVPANPSLPCLEHRAKRFIFLPSSTRLQTTVTQASAPYLRQVLEARTLENRYYQSTYEPSPTKS